MDGAVLEISKIQVFGPIIVILGSTIFGLALYIRTLINDNLSISGECEKRINTFQNKLNDIYEARVQESRNAIDAIKTFTVSIQEISKPIEKLVSTVDRVIMVLDKVTLSIDSNAVKSKEYVLNIESILKENRDLLLSNNERTKEVIKCCQETVKQLKGIRE